MLDISTEAYLAARAIRSAKDGGSTVAEGKGTLGYVEIDIQAAGDNLIIPPSAGGKIRVVEISVYNTSEQTIIFKDGTASSFFKLPNFGVGGWQRTGEKGDACFVLTAGNGFYINLSAAARVTGFVRYEVG
jgi:hypothetical protein